jgi:hypothetical protein
MSRPGSPGAFLAAAALCAVASACAAAAAPVGVQQAPSPVVTAQLDSAVTLMAAQGFALAEGYRSGSLADGAETVVSLNFTGGRTYLVAAVCDADCSDLDLELTTASGAAVDSDYELDDVPMVMAEVDRTERYDLTVSMAACGVEPCAYGVAVFVQ